jgi:hypothetical protein
MAFSQEIPLAPHTHVPINAPDVAWHFPYGAAGFHIPFNGTCNETLSRIYRRGYAAAVSYSDYNVGVLLDKLDALGLTASTLVTVIGDHGWHLGDKDTYVRTSSTCLADSSTMFTLILAHLHVIAQCKSKSKISVNIVEESAKQVLLVRTYVSLSPRCQPWSPITVTSVDAVRPSASSLSSSTPTL